MQIQKIISQREICESAYTLEKRGLVVKPLDYDLSIHKAHYFKLRLECKNTKLLANGRNVARITIKTTRVTDYYYGANVYHHCWLLQGW